MTLKYVIKPSIIAESEETKHGINLENLKRKKKWRKHKSTALQHHLRKDHCISGYRGEVGLGGDIAILLRSRSNSKANDFFGALREQDHVFIFHFFLI